MSEETFFLFSTTCRLEVTLLFETCSVSATVEFAFEEEANATLAGCASGGGGEMVMFSWTEGHVFISLGGLSKGTGRDIGIVAKSPTVMAENSC